jgi:amino-acid N-acetyltransferase
MQAGTRTPGLAAREGRMSVIRARPPLAAARSLLESAELPTSDLTEAHCEHFFYWGAADAPGGLVGLEPLGDVALLRSLVVSADARSSGMGSTLVRFAENHARALGIRAVYLLTTTAEGFFHRLGYERLARDLAPPSIKSTTEFSSLCPSSSAFMIKQL